MNKTLRVILNILLVAASLALAISLLNLMFSIQYANREVEDPVERDRRVFEYELKHRAYNEILGGYYSERIGSLEPGAGYEDIYRIGGYAHAAFMSRVCDEKGDAKKATTYRDKAAGIRKELGPYEYAADEIDEVIEK